MKQKQKREEGRAGGAAAGDESDGGASDPSAEDGEEKGGDVTLTRTCHGGLGGRLPHGRGPCR